MTSEEKQERIIHLSHKFYDINERPSLLLRSEMEGIEQDKCMSDWLKNIENLESRYHKLEDEYNSSVAPELRKLKRVFEYEQEQVIKKYEKEKLIQPFTQQHKKTNGHIDQIYKKKLSELKIEQEKQKNDLVANVKGNLEMCEEQIRLAFLSAIKYIYR